MNRDLMDALEEARGWGLIGPLGLEVHIRHSLGFGRSITARAGRPKAALDLGSGGGLPGLVLATAGRDRMAGDGASGTRSATTDDGEDEIQVPSGLSWTLLDGRSRATRFLRAAVERLGLESEVRVVQARAEEWARSDARQSFDVVVARSFGPPAVTAECAAGFLRLGGALIVSEPPREATLETRWPPVELDELGFGPSSVTSGEFSYRVLELVRPCSERYPRRVGIPAKRPLF